MNTNAYLKSSAPIVLRVGVSAVLLWFGFQQLLHTDVWTGYVPAWVISFSSLSATTLVYVNGFFEIVFGALLLCGFFTRAVAFLLALHMIDITFTVGYSSIGVRDFGLTAAVIAVFLYGADRMSADYLFKK